MASRKDYTAIAAILKTAAPQVNYEVLKICTGISDYFAENNERFDRNNERFDREKFLAACGLEGFARPPF